MKGATVHVVGLQQDDGIEVAKSMGGLKIALTAMSEPSAKEKVMGEPEVST